MLLQFHLHHTVHICLQYNAHLTCLSLGGLIPPKIATPGHLVSTTAHLILEAIHDSKLTFLPFFRDFFTVVWRFRRRSFAPRKLLFQTA